MFKFTIVALVAAICFAASNAAPFFSFGGNAAVQQPNIQIGGGFVQPGYYGGDTIVQTYPVYQPPPPPKNIFDSLIDFGADIIGTAGNIVIPAITGAAGGIIGAGTGLLSGDPIGGALAGAGHGANLGSHMVNNVVDNMKGY